MSLGVLLIEEWESHGNQITGGECYIRTYEL